MKDIKDFILEASNTNNINKFKKLLKKYKVVLQGPDGTGIAYITTNMKNTSPSICIDTYDNYWCCYLDDDEDGSIWISLDEEGTADKKLDSSKFDKSGNKFTYSEKNAKELAAGLLSL